MTQGAHGTVAITPTANYAVKVASGQDINVGSVLAYDKSQPWTIMATIDVAQNPGPSEAAVIASNQRQSRLRASWLSSCLSTLRDICASVSSATILPDNNYIEVQSSVVVTDGKWHDVAVSYDGSSSASGVKIYEDGKQDTGCDGDSQFADRSRSSARPQPRSSSATQAGSESRFTISTAHSTSFRSPTWFDQRGLYRAILRRRGPLLRSTPIRCSTTISTRTPAPSRTTCRRTATPGR